MGTPTSDNWDRGDPYERYIGRWSKRVAPLFLGWLAIPAGLRWLDVGCGTGALGAAILDACAPATLVGVEPSQGFLEVARQRIGSRATLLPGNAASLALEPSSVDVIVSGLVLNFIPDLPAALAEMKRVAAPGGTIAAYVWDYAGKMELLRVFWDAAVELDPAVAPMDEGRRFPICQPAALAAAFMAAGLVDVDTSAIDIPTPFADFDDYWTPFLGGQGPAPAYVMSLADEARDRLRERLRSRLAQLPGGPQSMSARAWAARATVVH